MNIDYIIFLIVLSGAVFTIVYFLKHNDKNKDNEDEQEDEEDLCKNGVNMQRPLQNNKGYMCHMLALMHLFACMSQESEKPYFNEIMKNAIKYVNNSNDKECIESYNKVLNVCDTKQQDSPINDIDKLYFVNYLNLIGQIQINVEWVQIDKNTNKTCNELIHTNIKYITLKWDPKIKKDLDMKQLLEEYTLIKILANNCIVKKTTFKQLILDKYLLIELPRGDSDKKKIDTNVKVNVIIQLNENIYILKACIVHRGSTISSGHYVCYVNTDTTNNQTMFVLYNDSQTPKCSVILDEECDKNGVLFLYEKII